MASLWRGKWLIALAMLVGALIAYALVSQVPPKYTARASVMLDPRTVEVLSDNVVSDVTFNNPFLDTEAALLRSSLVLRRVINRFDDAQLAALDPLNQSPSLKQRLTTRLRGLTGGDAPATDAPAVPAAQGLSPEELRLRRLVVALRRSIWIRREGDSYLIAVTVQTEDAELSARLANAIVEEYIDNQVEQRVTTVQNATSFLEERVLSMQAAVEEAESAVENIRMGQLAEAGTSAEALEQQLRDLSTQLALARADRAATQARYQQIQSVIAGEGFEAASELLSSPFVLSLREELSALKRQDADLATTLGREHPERQRLAASIELLAADLAVEVRKILSSLRNDVEVAGIRIDSLQESLGQIEERSGELSRAGLELRQREREADAARNSYETALSRLNETRSVEQLQRPEARMIERAVVPGAPSAPRVKLFTVFGAATGFSIGLILVFLLAVTGGGYRRPAQIERDTGMQVLVSLPKSRWRNHVGLLKSLEREPYQAFAERLRHLRTMLKPTDRGTGAHTVLVTSSVPGEGKTTMALALAHSEVAAHRSCVLLDFDVRRSDLARDLGYAREGGDLADYLRGDCTLDDALYRPEGQRFDIITTVRPAPGLVDDTSADELETLLAELKSRYDMVIIDTPPLYFVADAMPLVRMADTTLLLVRQGTTRPAAVASSLRNLQDGRANGLGIVLTMVDPRDEKLDYGVSRTYAYGRH